MLCGDENNLYFALEIYYFQSPLARKCSYDLHLHSEIQFPARTQIFGLRCQLSCVVALILVLLCYLLYFSQEELQWKKETTALQHISVSVLVCWILTEVLWSHILLLAAVATGSEYPVWGTQVSTRRQYSSYGHSHSKTSFPKTGHLGEKNYIWNLLATQRNEEKRRRDHSK